MSVVLDSNLWISAFIFRGRPLEMGLDRLVDIAVSQSIIDETLRVMNDKFHAKPIVLESALFIMTTSAPDGGTGHPGKSREGRSERRSRCELRHCGGCRSLYHRRQALTPHEQL
jgi:hypothetical protein